MMVGYLRLGAYSAYGEGGYEVVGLKRAVEGEKELEVQRCLGLWHVPEWGRVLWVV